MTPNEAIEATRRMENRDDATYAHMTTLEDGRIYIKAIYPNPKHIGEGDSTYVWDSTTGSLIRRTGGK